MRSPEQDRRVHLATIIETTIIDPVSGSERHNPISVEPPERLVLKELGALKIHNIQLPFSMDDFESLEERTETTYTGIRRIESLSVIERLRAQHPGENIVRLGVGLKDLSSMSAFYFQYADELKTSSPLETVREHHYDTARGHITRMANHVDREAVNRWREFFATGTVRDTSLDWLTKSGTQTRVKEIRREGKVRPAKKIQHKISFSTIQSGATGMPRVTARSVSGR